MRATANRMHGKSVLWTVGAVVLLGGVVCSAQSGSSTIQTTSQRTMGTAMQDVYDTPLAPRGDPVFVERRLRQLNAAQHDAMVADTRKLVKLVTELNADISNNNSRKLTAQQLRTVAEIEKLARSVRDKMRMSVRPAPDGLGNTYVPSFGQRE